MRSAADVSLLAKVAAAAAGGGLLAMAVLWLDGRLGRPLLVAAFVLAVVVFCVMAVGSLMPASRPSRVTRAQPGRWTPPQTPTYPSTRAPLQQVVPATPPPVPATSAHTWHLDAARDAAALDAAPITAAAVWSEPLRPSEPDLDGRPPRYEEHPVSLRTTGIRRIVQCPRCGDFAVDVWDETRGFSFTCRPCQHRWHWAPGQAWPATVIRPAYGASRRSAGPA